MPSNSIITSAFYCFVAPVEISFNPADNVYSDGVHIAASSSGEVVVRRGSDLSVVFGAVGVGAEDIRWTKDGSALPLDEDNRLTVTQTSEGSQLTVTNVNASDSGSYVAEASRNGEVASASLDVRVAGNLDTPKQIVVATNLPCCFLQEPMIQ